ncbi:MAG: ABC transporter permease, partial [Alphaproteobacteria bacterium]
MTFVDGVLGTVGRRLHDRIEPGLRVWLVAGAGIVVLFALGGQLPWLVKFPEALMVPLNEWLNVVMYGFVDVFKPVFRAITWFTEFPMTWLQGFLHWLPWPAAFIGVVAIAHRAGGGRLALFALGSLLYLLITGYWDPSMNTLALVGVAVPASLVAGFLGGLLAFKSRRAERIIQPTLDLMQTVPTFAYLIPILLLFGLGPVVGLIASAIYAAPPMVRNTLLGLRRVPPEIVESARMSGSTNRQLLWWVQVPTALPTILVGVNQTIMAALSLVIIAAIIGAFADIGWELLSTLRKAEFGRSLLAGVCIVLIAMVLDRVSRGMADRPSAPYRDAKGWRRHQGVLGILAAMAAVTVAAQAVPFLHDYPASWELLPKEPLDAVVSFINTTFPATLEWIKIKILFYFLLPLHKGFAVVAKPLSWGFEVTATVKAVYAFVVAGAALGAARIAGWPAALAVVLLGGVYFFGMINVPWSVFVLVVGLLAYRVAGLGVTLFAVAAMAFMLLSGIWHEVMVSIYLCGAAVLVSSLAGGAVGVWAALNDRVSAVVRPVVDLLQTMPTFVYLIPVIMFFQVGDLPALLAIISYSIAPAIRYTEHGIRHVRTEAVEAARSMGCTPRQVLFQVQLPLALPEIML